MFIWTILEIFATDGVVHAVKYCVEYNGLKTEGVCQFSSIKVKIPFDKLDAGIVKGWLKNELTVNEVNLVEANLLNQAAGLQNKVKIPWQAPTFTPFGE